MKSRGKVYSTCIPSVILYGSECWAVTTVDAQRLQRNERAMIHWICKVKISAQKMKFSIKDLFSKCDQIRRKQQIWSHLLKKSLKGKLHFLCSGNKISSDILLNKLCLKNINIMLRTNRLRWVGHVCRSEGFIKKCTQHGVAGKQERDRPGKICRQCVICDLKSLKLSKYLTSNLNAWREALRNGEKPNPQEMWNRVG